VAVQEIPEVRNLYLMMVDSLRWDFAPKLKGTTVCTIVQGNNTPRNFPVILSGRTDHGVNWFTDRIKVPTVLDLEGYDVSYYDHPDDPFKVKVLGDPPKKELKKMKPPFVYVERETSAHAPYGRNWREERIEIRRNEGRRYPDLRGREYIAKMMRGQVDFVSDYKKGVEKAKLRFLAHARKLKEMGEFENTLMILTSDHGDAWGENGGWMHNVTTPETIHVPTPFFTVYIDKLPQPFLSKHIVRYFKPFKKQFLDEK